MCGIIEKIKQYRLLIILILLLAIKIIIVQVQPLNAKYTMQYDDQLMIEMSENILAGNWLGEYNSKTLIKGVFTPLFISFMNISNIPFLIGKEFFYGIACIIITIILKRKIKSKIALIMVYIVLLFNPVEYSSELSRAYRDGIYMSLIIYMLAFSFGVFLSRKEKIRKQIKYFIGLGFSVTAVYLCREENIWIYPFIIFMIGVTCISIIIDKNLKNKIKRIALYMIPIMIFLVCINTICIINYQYYGVYTLNQYWGEPFKEAYGALIRVIPEEEKARVPVTNETLQRLYQYSPKLAELQEFFDGPEAERWRACGERIEGEINGGYFHWALMEAVESRGYYKDAKAADEYYLNLAEEINKLCDQGIVKGRNQKIINNSCYFDANDILETITKMPETIMYQYELEEVEMIVSNPGSVVGLENEEEQIEKMEKITNHKIETVTHYVGKWNNFRIKIIDSIKNIYAFFNKYLFYISIFLFLIFVLTNIKNLKGNYENLIILIALISLYVSRIFIVTFTREMMFKEALNVSYLSCVYNIQFLFTIVVIIFFIENFRRKYNERRNRIDNINSST